MRPFGSIRALARVHYAAVIVAAMFAPMIASAAITTSGNLSGTGTPYNGTDDPWTTSLLIVGDTSVGNLTISGGSKVTNPSDGVIANTAGASTSSVLITGAGSNLTNSTGTLSVGVGGAGALTITDGAGATNSVGMIGSTSTGIGSVSIGGGSGTSTWTNSATLSVGLLGTGSLTIVGGGTVRSVNAFVGSTSGSVGTVTVGGGVGTSTWTSSGDLAIGKQGTGMLTIVGGGVVRNVNGTIGASGGTSANFGAVTVGGGTGAATWTNSSNLTIGGSLNASGSLTIVGGGSVKDSIGAIGAGVGSHGEVSVGGGTGPAVWTNSGNMTIGISGTATLNIIGGGTVYNAIGVIGGAVSGNGTVTVGGGIGAATWNNSSNLSVGDSNNSIAMLNIISGGAVNDTAGFIAGNSAAIGTVTVGDGNGAAVWNNSTSLAVGGDHNGTAVLNILTGGLVIASTLDGGNANSSVYFNGGTLRITGTDSASNIINLLSAGGTLDVPTAASTLTITSNITGNGGLTKTGVGTLVLAGTNNYTGPTFVTAGTLNLTGALTGGGDVTVSTGATLTATNIVAPGHFTNNGDAFGNVTLASGGTLAGTGNIHGTLMMADGSTYAPGNSPGMQTVDHDVTWGNMTYQMQIADVAGAQGVGYDSLSVTGSLNIVGTNIAVNVDSYPANTQVAHFSNGSPFDLILVSTTNGVENFVGSNFHVDSSLFEMANSLGGGSFSVILSPDGDDLFLHFTSAVPEPATLALFSLSAAALGYGLRRKRQTAED